MRIKASKMIQFFGLFYSIHYVHWFFHLCLGGGEGLGFLGGGGTGLFWGGEGLGFFWGGGGTGLFGGGGRGMIPGFPSPSVSIPARTRGYCRFPFASNRPDDSKRMEIGLGLGLGLGQGLRAKCFSG